MNPPNPAKASLRIHRRTPLSREVRRIARAQIDAACRVLADEKDARRAVHEARKSLKKLRAILRLVAPEFSRSRFQMEKRAFQDAAKQLAPLRDAEVRILTFDALIQHAKFAPEDFADVREELETVANLLERRADTPKRSAVEILQAVRKRIASWPLNHLEWKLLAREICRAYRKGRKALQRYKREASPQTFHAWRKRVKELWYHLRIARDFLPESVSRTISECRKIGELAGLAQDMAVLQTNLATRRADHRNALLIAEIERRLPELHEIAAKHGARLYAQKPREFAKWAEEVASTKD